MKNKIYKKVQLERIVFYMLNLFTAFCILSACSASTLTESATTAKPLPASPALAASIPTQRNLLQNILILLKK
jgi:hypothetical protein